MKILIRKLALRMPSVQQILPVFSTIVFIEYSWMLYHFFRQVPSWLYYMSIGNVLILLAYVLSYTLFESLLMLVILLALSLAFSPNDFKTKFTTQGFIQVFLISGIILVLREEIDLFPKLDLWVLVAIPVVALVLIVFSSLVFSRLIDRFQILPRFLNALADRMTIFTYLYVPFSLVGTLVVILRNIF